MKLALIGDIHSNHMALEKCLFHCEAMGIDGYIFLGDYISDCPYPQKTLELLRKVRLTYPSWFLRGNREDYQISHDDGANDGWHYSSNSGSLLYTYENLTNLDLDFFRQCPITMELSFAGMPKLTLCHGSPDSSKDLLEIDSPLAKRHLEKCPTDILICAHTHHQGIYCNNNKLLINPGSVGIPIGSDGKLQFAVLHGQKGEWYPEFLSLEYDVNTFIQQYYCSELMQKAYTFAKVIPIEVQTGHNYLLDILEKTRELALAAEKTVNPSDMPEQYWEEAFHLLKLDSYHHSIQRQGEK